MHVARSWRSFFGVVVLSLALQAVPARIPIQHPPAARVTGTLHAVATVGGQPDDITIDAQGHLIWGDLSRGTVERLVGGHVVIVARSLSVPEGIVALPDGTLLVAEQGRDRIVRITRNDKSSVFLTLRPVSGQEGVDGIGRNPRTGELVIPDSPRGAVLGVSPDGRHVRVIARGLGRPVDAAFDAQGNILVPDENLGALVVISPRGTATHEGTLSTPDDVAVDSMGRVWITTLGDGGLWTIDPGTHIPYRVVAGLADPQGLTLDRCGDPIIVEQNTALIVRWLPTSPVTRCSK